MMKSSKTPWMPADKFGSELRGVGLNLLVADIAATTRFVQTVCNATIVYEDEDFAVVEVSGGNIILHADHTYADHNFSASIENVESRGSGVEIRLYNMDPDLCESRARQHDYIVLNGAMDKPHGLREAYLLDPDGYCWVVSRPLVPKHST